jgi:hypothetical protein
MTRKVRIVVSFPDDEIGRLRNTQRVPGTNVLRLQGDIS